MNDTIGKDGPTLGVQNSCDECVSEWNDAPGADQRIGTAEVSIREITDLKTAAKVLVRNVYFDGGDVLHCYAGRFRFVLDDERTVEIGPGEALCIYPEHRVTIESLDAENRLVYCILFGSGVPDYLDGLGFYDGMKGSCNPQFESVQEIMRLLKSDAYSTPEGRRKCLSHLSDALVTIVHDVRRTGIPLLIHGIRQIRANLKNRIVRIDPLCEQLKVSHAYLHRVFIRSGLVAPSEFIRQEQLRLVMRLLRNTAKPVYEIAEESGFISTTHFANFIKRYTGKTAKELRRSL